MFIIKYGKNKYLKIALKIQLTNSLIMEIKELLRDIKLNKYESIIYEIILRRGIAKASTISREGNIPFGKIYESLGNLFSKGLIEVQNTRPKKYKIRDPKIAFQKILNEKALESENELKNLKSTLIQIEEKINKVNTEDPKEKTFWITAVGDEIEEMMKGLFNEAKKEICMIPYIINKKDKASSALLNIPKILKEIDKTAERGVKIRAIFPEDFAQTQIKIFKKMKFFKKIVDNIEIRILKDLSPEPFTIIDVKKTILRVNDPLNDSKILAMIKITDETLSLDLKNKFDEMWSTARPIN